jgi:hypothetical protein
MGAKGWLNMVAKGGLDGALGEAEELGLPSREG